MDEYKIKTIHDKDFDSVKIKKQVAEYKQKFENYRDQVLSEVYLINLCKILTLEGIKAIKLSSEKTKFPYGASPQIIALLGDTSWCHAKYFVELINNQGINPEKHKHKKNKIL